MTALAALGGEALAALVGDGGGGGAEQGWGAFVQAGGDAAEQGPGRRDQGGYMCEGGGC